jgi:N-acyl-D-amino-acid deacylase
MGDPGSRLLIRGAEVVDGTGAPRVRSDVLLHGDTVVAIAPPGQLTAPKEMDASGKILCPGFIDTHSHDDALVLERRIPHPKLTQGVTTVVTGNCGISLAPLVTQHPPAPLDLLGPDSYRFPSFRAYLDALDNARPALNVVPLVGHNTLRVAHLADWRVPATAEETECMRRAVAQAMDDGAFGLSTGVFYPPSRAAGTDELLAVCGPVGERNGIVAMHIRDEGDQIDAALKEALDVGAMTGVRLVLSHHKVVGAKNFGRTRHTLSAVDIAARTQAVCLDCYPYEASSTMLSPAKAAATGHVLISWSKPHPECAGRALESIARDWNVGLEEAATRLLPGGAIYFGMSTEDVDRVLAHPLTMVGSDGLPHDARPHPRLWGTFPRVLSHYVRERRLLTLEEAIRKMTGLPAQRFGLAQRGKVAVGHVADLVLFDPETVEDRARYEDPQAPPAGIHAVFVNGKLAVQNGQILESHAGHRLTP